MGNFDELIIHLNRKKPKKGDNGYFGKPIIQEKDNMLFIDYNHYYVTVYFDPLHKTPYQPRYCDYKLSIEKPCVISRGGGQDIGTAFSESWWSTLEDVWLELQSKWGKTII